MLEINEARYRGIVEDQTEFITRFLPDEKLVFVNDAYARYLGKDKEALIGTPHIPNLDEEDISAVSRSIRSLNKDNPVITFECRIHHTYGKDRWNVWTVRGLFNDEKEPLEFQGIGKDNTEKREAATRINQYIKEMEFFLQSTGVCRVASERIYHVIGEGLSELLPIALIGVNSYDTMSESFIATAVFPDKDHDLLNSSLGKEFMGFKFPISAIPQTLRPFVQGELLKGKIFHSNESIYNFFFQQIPEDICMNIKKILKLGDTHYGIGLARHGILFGGVNFTLRDGETLRNSQLIETYIRQASVVLHRRLTEDSLRKSEFRYRGIVEDQTEFIIRYLPDGTITFANGSFCRYFGIAPHEAPGRSIFSFIGKDDQAPLHELLKSLDARHPVQPAEYHITDLSGSTRWNYSTTRAIFDDNGTLVEYQSVGRDVTEQKEAEAKIRQYIADREFLTQTAMGFMNLRDDENLYQYIADQIHTLIPDQVVAVCSITPSERIVTLQSVAGLDAAVMEEFRNLGVHLMGRSFSLDKDPDTEAILKTKYLTPGPPLYNLLFREIPEDICTHLENLMGFGKSYVMGFVYEGTIFGSVIIILRPGQGLENKEILELFLSQVSIALLRRNTRQELTESERLYRSVIENIQDVFYRSDTEGKLIMASPSWAKVLGYDSLDDCIGFNIADKFWLEPELRKAFLDTIYKFGSVNDYEVVLKRRDGTPFYVSTNSHLYYDNTGMLLGVEESSAISVNGGLLLKRSRILSPRLSFFPGDCRNLSNSPRTPIYLMPSARVSRNLYLTA
jgi:PAS domain S-box-containing protein